MERCNAESNEELNGWPLNCELDKGHDSGTFPREVIDPDRKPWEPLVFLLEPTPHRVTIEWPSE